MDLQVGMYARYKNPLGNRIKKIVSIFYDSIYFPLPHDGMYYIPKNDILIASFNIIDLVQLGDYVNGMEVTRICFDEYGNRILNLSNCSLELTNDDIKSVVTKERFDNVKFNIL